MIASIFRRFRHAGRDLLKDEKGGLSMFMAVGVVAFVGIAGVSVDAMRGYLVQSRLSSALDAAGLAGARVMYSPTRDADIQMFFDSNFPAGYMGANVTGPTFSVDAANEVLTLTAQATINTTLTQILGYDSFTVAATSEITRETEMLDVVLAIDMSGSMGFSLDGGTRIDAARDAALELVNILYGEDGLAPLLNIGLVPWSGKVNVTRNGIPFDPGATVTAPVTTFTHPIAGGSQSNVYLPNNSPVPLLAPPPADWKGCVYTRYLEDGFTNDADLDVGPVTAVGGKDWPAWEYIGAEGEPVPGSAECTRSPNSFQDCTSCLTHGITPLQSTKAGIDAAINELVAPTGSTEILGGLAWAWRVLVPEAPFTEAEINPAGQRTQAIILLTDGQYTSWWGDAYKTQFGFNTAAQGQAEPRLRSLATKIKDSGVVIYTIQFANTDGDLADLMKDVASGPDAPFYNPAPTAAELQDVFREVANDLSQLRLSM